MTLTPPRQLDGPHPVPHWPDRQLELDQCWRCPLESSDVLYETLRKVHAGNGQCWGMTEPELVWGRPEILPHAVTSELQKNRAGKHGVTPERSLVAALHKSSARRGGVGEPAAGLFRRAAGARVGTYGRPSWHPH